MTILEMLDRPAARQVVSTAASRRFRLRGRGYKAALTAHILASVGWFGIAIVVGFCGIAAAVTDDPTLPPALLRVIETAPWMSVPVGLVAIATGALLGLGTAFGLVRHWWVIAKIGIAVSVIVTDAVLVGRIAHEAVATGTIEPALYGSTIAHVVVLAIATVFSVFKPGGRTPWSRPRANPANMPTGKGTKRPRIAEAVAIRPDARTPGHTGGRGSDCTIACVAGR